MRRGGLGYRGARAIIAASLTAMIYTGSASAQTGRATPAETSPARPTVDYVMKPGDTLSDLARAYLLRVSDYQQVQWLNRVRNDRRMAVGQVVRFPVDLLRTEPAQARVTGFRGAVTILQGGQSATPTVGQIVSEDAVIATGANAFVRLGLPDGGHVTLPSQSRVRVGRLRTILLNGALDQEMRVETGRAEASAAPVRAPGGFAIRTPVSVSAVRGTQFRVSYDDEGDRAATEVIEGLVGVSTPGAQGEGALLDAAARQGVVSAKGSAHLTDLAPAPELLQPDRIQSAAAVALTLRPQGDIAYYRARLANDAGMIDAFAEARSKTADDAVVFDQLDDGAYFVRLTAVTTEGVEGLASNYSLLRARNGLSNLAASVFDRGRERRYLFRWEAQGAGDVHFRFQIRPVSTDPDVQPVIDEARLDAAEITLTGLKPGDYEWRVRATRQAFGRILETWSEPQTLHIGR